VFDDDWLFYKFSIEDFPHDGRTSQESGSG
jgi:hypothetical protein